MNREENVKNGIWIVMILSAFLAGCATSQDRTQLTSLQMRINEMEKDQRQKEQVIQELSYQVKDLSQDLERIKGKANQARSEKLAAAKVGTTKVDKDIIRVSVSAEQAQTALKNAGYYKGTVDGKIGDQTKIAISQFQKDHNLKADGILGQGTWTELSTYLDQ